MQRATGEVLTRFEREYEAMKNRILASADERDISGRVYYVSSRGDDLDTGLDPDHPWRTAQRVSSAALKAGDGVLFRRGDLFRGQLLCRAGVTYAAWGDGEKPRLYGWDKDLADPALWEAVDGQGRIYRLTEKIPDCGTLVFDGGERHSRKLIPSYIGGRFVNRDDPKTPFDMREAMTEALDLFCDCRAVMTNAMSHGETWPVPDTRQGHRGDLYLRCDEGNPGRVFRSIEALPGRHAVVVGDANGVTIDNLCIKYCGAHAVSAGGPCVKGLRVSNCEIGWVGGTIQHYLGTDPNFPEGKRGTVTRFGNGIEIYGGCEDYLCRGNYVYQVYDAGVTHQYTIPAGETCVMKNVRYSGNLIEKCVYSIEYFLSNTQGGASLMDGLEIDGNFLRLSGYGWGQQRHNIWTPAHIKSWNFENPARNYVIHDNIFDRARYRLLHLCCQSPQDRPRVYNNTYIQTLGLPLGQFGDLTRGDPPILSFFETSDAALSAAAGDARATAYWVP